MLMFISLQSRREAAEDAHTYPDLSLEGLEPRQRRQQFTPSSTPLASVCDHRRSSECDLQMPGTGRKKDRWFCAYLSPPAPGEAVPLAC